MILTLDDFKDMEKIERYYYSADQIATPEDSYAWYCADSNSCVAIKRDNKVVGFINILSLKEDIFMQIKNDLMNEHDLRVQDLELNKDRYMNYLYFSCIAIDPLYRQPDVFLQLIRAYQTTLNKILSDGACIKEVMSDCITNEGQRASAQLLHMHPYKQTSHSTTIYVASGDLFLQNKTRGNYDT